MKKQILITACSLDIGGIERSLVGLLNGFDYEKYDVDLLLFSQSGEFLPFLPAQCNVLPEIPQLASLQKPIQETLISGHGLLAGARLFSKIKVRLHKAASPENQNSETTFSLLQAYWDSSCAFMPNLKKEYDAVLSFMWPHHYAAKKVHAAIKIAWIHTDYTVAVLDNERDEAIWREFDRIAAVSEECGKAFLSVYPALSEKMTTVENILSTEFVRSQAEEFLPEEMESGSRLKLLSIGRFCYAKAFDFAAEICRQLLDKHIDVTWYIIGYGSDEEKIREKIRELSLEDRFIILGKKKNPYPYIKACDIYVQPSRYEGKAVTVREAQMLGKPVIITNFKTAKSQVKDGFDAMISPMDVHSVADTVIQLSNDDNLRNVLSKNALESDYSNAGQLEHIYRLIEDKDV